MQTGTHAIKIIFSANRSLTFVYQQRRVVDWERRSHKQDTATVGGHGDPYSSSLYAWTKIVPAGRNCVAMDPDSGLSER